MPNTINSFRGKHHFLSNFFPCEITYDGSKYASLEAAFQASKTLDRRERFQIQTAPSPGTAKRLGRDVTKRQDWDNIRLVIMEDLLRQKFAQPEFRDKLLDTGDATLVEGNSWGDSFWGVCNGVGENQLGRLLMKIRKSL